MQIRPHDFAPTWKWWLPPRFSSYGDDVDTLYYWIFWITMVTFVLVEGALVWFCFKYKKDPARKAVYTHGNHKLEVWWTVIPAVILVALGVFSANTWATIKNSTSPTYPKEFQTTVRIRAQQFAWNVGYAGTDGKFDTDDDFETKNILHVPYEPVGPDGTVEREENVRVMLTSQDVIHSFFAPVLRLKQDAVPGYIGNIWFDVQQQPGKASPPTRPGPDGKYFTLDDEVYEVACAELCGIGHSTMRMELKALPRDVWEAWVAEKSAAAAKLAAEKRGN
jgi:cytochrome c oxidase subunit 2